VLSTVLIDADSPRWQDSCCRASRELCSYGYLYSLRVTERAAGGRYGRCVRTSTWSETVERRRFRRRLSSWAPGLGNRRLQRTQGHLHKAGIEVSKGPYRTKQLNWTELTWFSFWRTDQWASNNALQ